MAKSATDIVRDVINAAVVDAIVALKDASRGLPNALIRDLASVHANAAFSDLPPCGPKIGRRERTRGVRAAAQGRLCNCGDEKRGLGGGAIGARRARCSPLTGSNVAAGRYASAAIGQRQTLTITGCALVHLRYFGRFP